MVQFQIKDILSHFTECKFVGDENCTLSSVVALNTLTDEEKRDAITWVSDKNIDGFDKKISVGLFILSAEGYEKFKGYSCNFLISQSPRFTFLKLLSLKFSSERKPTIENTAVIHPTAKLGNACYIGHHVVIEEDATIGNNVEILHNTVILKGTLIGNNVKIGANNTIGNYGFGYEKDGMGEYLQVTHLGNVVIMDNVAIHNNTTIDRAVIGSTIIGSNTKVDNHVNIGHGVKIGKNCLIIGTTEIAGSVTIGDNCWISPGVTILNKVKIGDNCFVGIGSVIIKDADSNAKLIGNPAINFNTIKK